MELLLSNTDRLIDIATLIIVGIFLRILLQVLGQRWITTIAHSATLCLLPLIAYVVTSVISGNIALSLGMVGALSIVRFRNPVRSPLELSVYFGSITLGIAASVDLRWVFFLVGGVIAISITLLTINYLSKILLNKPFFESSFTEGNALSSYEVISTLEISELENSIYLTAKHKSDNDITYYLSCNSFESLKSLHESIGKNSHIKTYQLNKF